VCRKQTISRQDSPRSTGDWLVQGLMDELRMLWKLGGVRMAPLSVGAK
jgi:hypothetical protein